MKSLVPCLLALAFAPPSQADCTSASGATIAPLVELYTSEGCSDCPPADAWLSRLALATPPEAATFLAFHVTYWDEIGWPDRFALKLADQRQELRVRLSGKRTTFTPQVMIGKDTTLDWRGRPNARGASRNATATMGELQRRDAAARLSMRTQARDGTLDVSFSAERDVADGEAWVWLALYEDGLHSEVRAGENKGMTLRHDRVVRALAGPWRMQEATLSRRVELPFPQAFDPGQAGLVLFVESAADASPLQSLQQRLAGCAVAAQ